MLIFLGKHLGRPRVGAVGTDERAQCSLGIGSMCFFWLTAYVLERATSEKDESLFSPFTVFFEPGRKLGWYFSALNHSPMKGKTIQSRVQVLTTYWYKRDFLWIGERATFLSVFRVRMKLYLHPTIPGIGGTTACAPVLIKIFSPWISRFPSGRWTRRLWLLINSAWPSIGFVE